MENNITDELTKVIWNEFTAKTQNQRKDYHYSVNDIRQLIDKTIKNFEQNSSTNSEVPIGYWFLDEYQNEVTVLHIFDKWCIVEDDSKDEPYLLELEYIKNIKQESEACSNP